MKETMLPKGALVYVISYGPFFGCKGIIHAIDVIGENGPEPVYFYLVELQDGPSKKLWLEHDAIVAVAGNVVPFEIAV
ncbi:MAG TPA: hypothetical protein VFV38_00815 [Ktedonobacteraceae bacterium]|nr:hypothetical protein [Ktedonobacteraceae bacterium]